MRLWFVLLGALAFHAQACTTMVLPDKATLTIAKNLDWPEREGFLVIHPRHQHYQAKTDPLHNHPLSWQSQFGSVIFHGQTKGVPGPSADGMNERGLTVSVMMLPGSDYPTQTNRPQLNMGLWSQYLLDNYQSVSEVLANLHDYELWPESYHGYTLKFHLYVNDAAGHEAIIEYAQGQPLIYQDEAITVKNLTNSFYDLSTKRLPKYKVFGGLLPLPGDYDSLSRFIRASAYLKRLPSYNESERIAYAFDGLAAVAQPPGVGSVTQLSMVFDIGQQRLYFRSVNHADLRKIDLKNIDFNRLDQAIIYDPFAAAIEKAKHSLPAAAAKT